MDQEQKVYQVLDDLGIGYQKYEHVPVYTIPELEKENPEAKGTHCKNLFLRNAKGNKHYLVLLTSEKTVDLGRLAEKIGTTKLSFASERRMDKYLSLGQGAVSPFGLINDQNNEVEMIIDQDIKLQAFITVHPNVNTASVSIDLADFEKFLDWVGNKVQFVKMS